MTATLRIFETNETLHALDNTTGIWAVGKVLGHESDWSLRLRWVEWSGRKPVVYTLPDNLRGLGVETWTIRKKVALPHVTGRRPRQATHPIIAGPYKAFTGKTRTISGYDEIRSDSPLAVSILPSSRIC